MPVLSKRSLLLLWEANGASHNLSGDLNWLTLTMTRQLIDLTGFGDLATQRGPGIRDAKLTGGAVYGARAGDDLNTLLVGLMAASQHALLRYYPAGSFTGQPIYSGCFLANLWEIQGEAKATATAAFGFDLSSGSLTRGLTTTPWTVGVTSVGQEGHAIS